MGLTQESVWQQVQNLLPKEFPNKLPDSLSLCVGVSGGLDSIVLLHLLSDIQVSQQKISNKVFHLKAIHINHQLQKDADSWADFCQKFCLTKDIPFQSINVELVEPKKSGIEAAARNARYKAFSEKLSNNDILLTAHHLDDQIETVFLHLLRGTGIEGAAAINPSSKFGGNYLLRPLLTFNRAEILEYAQQQKLQWIDDPSNSEIHFSRNYLRHEVLPVIEKRWPSYRQTIQRFSNNARSATNVLDDYISQDYIRCFNTEKHTLKIDTLIELSVEKRLMVIRHWIKQRSFSMPGEAVLLQIHAAIFADEDTNPLIEWGDAEVRRYRNEIYLLPRDNPAWAQSDFFLDLKKNHHINGLGLLSSHEVLGLGIKQQYADAQIKIVFRQGGEKCQPVGRQGTHSLKKLFQECAVPPWQREKMPIIMIENQIAGVVGLFYCFPFAAKKDEQGFIIKLNLELV